jgi:hypothetical protein
MKVRSKLVRDAMTHKSLSLQDVGCTIVPSLLLSRVWN